MMERANQRAREAGQRAATLDDTLATLADATPAAVRAAQSAESALAALGSRVAQALPGIQTAHQELVTAEQELARLERERAALTGVRVPAEATARDADQAAALAALEQARAAESTATGADTSARQALADCPQRAPLELIRQRRDEQRQSAARLPSARDRATRAAGVSARASSAVTAAAAELEELRAQRDCAARDVELAGQAAQTLLAEHAALAAVAVPAGVGELDQRARTAGEALAALRRNLDAAETAERRAREAVDSATPRGALEQAERDLIELRSLDTDLRTNLASLDAARAGSRAAEAELAEASVVRTGRQRELDEARRACVAADLRPHLVAGEPCPVCDQPVTTLPAPLAAAGLDDAEAGLEKAIAAVDSAQLAVRDATTALTKAEAQAASLASQRAQRISSVARALAGPLSGGNFTAVAHLVGQERGNGAGAGTARDERADAALAELTGALEARAELERELRAAVDAAETARERTRSAQETLAAAERDTAAAWAELRSVRDPLVALGAPSAADDGNRGLAAAWAELVSWASAQARARAAELADARRRAQDAAGRLGRAQAGFDEAQASLTRLRADETRAARAEQEAQTRLGELTERLAELDRLLDGAPDEPEVTAQLARRDALEKAAAQAEAALLTARSARDRAEQALAGLQRAEAAGRGKLSAARDPLVGLGAPALDGGSLLGGWKRLADWAHAEAATRERQVPGAREGVAAARGRAERLTAELGAELAAGGVELEPAEVVSGAAPAVAAAAERARAAVTRLRERRAQADELTARRDAAREEQQVAKLLGDLLRTNRFPGWLVTAAVDTLVEYASKNLAELSGGQYDLTHTDGEFYVIDHADADSRRSVRTLSGGETFQASLALALALSTQMSALAASGATRLDSIFLDEGFGTLDPDSLDMVAGTLETLAQGQRMVGVITHVAELAERVPVRYRVSRDTRSSTIVREGLA
jgi:exonuclease SbcC